MKALLIKRIDNLAANIFRQVIASFSDAKPVNRVARNEYKKVEIAPSIFLTFQGWGENSRKPYFIILWRGSKYIMEFELSRIIFKKDNVLTWILNVPTRKENKKTLSALDYKLESIDPETINTIHKQMTSINGVARRTPKGYVMGRELNINDAINKFLEIIEYATKGNQQIEIKNLSGNDDIKVIEGQIAESKVLGKKRNQAIVGKRKNIDKHTCQACGFRLKIKDRYIIECHHKYPLRGETITNLDDLVCFCPTCHRIAHRKTPPFRTSEIRKILSLAKQCTRSLRSG